MKTIQFLQATRYAWQQLASHLNPLLTYHSLWHTQADVVEATKRLAKLEGLAGEPRILLITAAWYHDLGFTIQRADHETVGMQLVENILPKFGYTSAQITAIQGMIGATKLPQTPHTPLEEIIADADLDGLGRSDFLKTSLTLKAELDAFGIHRTYPEWYQGQKTFLSGHQYFRASARALRDTTKQENIAFLERLLAELAQQPE